VPPKKKNKTKKTLKKATPQRLRESVCFISSPGDSVTGRSGRHTGSETRKWRPS
jgi:hypothetical protein